MIDGLLGVVAFILVVVAFIMIVRKHTGYKNATKANEAREHDQFLERERHKKQVLEDERRNKQLGWDSILTQHHDVVDRFLEIAERKVSIVDEYGDEDWDALPEEIDRCMAKLAKRARINLSKWGLKDFGRYEVKAKALVGMYRDECAHYLSESLNSEFRKYHEARKNLPTTAEDFSTGTGIDFETQLAKLLKEEAGFESVVGTPTTGDQGADLIAKKDGKTIVIQAKRYKGPVGNGAVQEVVAAIRFYNAHEGWVVTNSTFTPSARALAHANNVRLIDGNQLRDMAKHQIKL